MVPSSLAEHETASPSPRSPTDSFKTCSPSWHTKHLRSDSGSTGSRSGRYPTSLVRSVTVAIPNRSHFTVRWTSYSRHWQFSPKEVEPSVDPPLGRLSAKTTHSDRILPKA